MAETPNSTFSSHNHEGRNVNGQVIGGIVVLGDYHAAGQSPSISSPCSSQPSTEEWQQKLVTVQMSLKEMYLQRFKKTNPFSFPFTFDIEDTWVSLVLKADRNCSQVNQQQEKHL
uniref:Uncharacterized protein n=1 Tax=Plectus sambesii TaxID=2011161 RepID=A0A914WUN5_9BILA